MSAADRRQIQTALARLGYDPGPVDGVFGPQTLAAIRRFQQAIGAEPTGVIKADEASRLVKHAGRQPQAERQAALVMKPEPQRAPAEPRGIEPRQ